MWRRLGFDIDGRLVSLVDARIRLVSGLRRAVWSQPIEWTERGTGFNDAVNQGVTWAEMFPTQDDMYRRLENIMTMRPSKKMTADRIDTLTRQMYTETERIEKLARSRRRVKRLGLLTEAIVGFKRLGLLSEAIVGLDLLSLYAESAPIRNVGDPQTKHNAIEYRMRLGNLSLALILLIKAVGPEAHVSPSQSIHHSSTSALSRPRPRRRSRKRKRTLVDP